MNERPRRSSVLRLLVSLVVLGLAVLVFFFRQQLFDQYSVWQYRPSAEIARIAEAAKLTDKGRFYFFASHPQIDERDAFNNHCTQRDEKTAILGCYSAGHIYIFNVSDDRLKGIREVTASHEMLHAAYDRLSDTDKKRINNLVENELAGITDTRIKELVAIYDKAEPGERANELHSILGTEVEALSPELETYYRQYFSDRQVVVGLSKEYEHVFEEISKEQEVLVADLNSLADEISKKSETYNSDTTHLNSDIATFNKRANSGGFSSQEEFDTQRSALVVRQAQIQTERTELNNMIALYNQKRQRLEALNGQAEALNRSINSQLSPVPSI